jgi:phosphohistidine phosphatase
MNLLLVRHAIAEDARRPGRDADARRPLTREGRRRMKQGARGLKALVPAVNLVASSPLRRALETAKLVRGAYGRGEVEEVDALAPGSGPEPLLAWLRGHRRAGTIALVGHEPYLSSLAGLLLTGRRSSVFNFKKGGACLLELDEPTPGSARLDWLVTARTLRELGADDAG